MRITNQFMTDNLMWNLNHNLQRIGKLQNQLSSCKRINKPSDDPRGIAEVLYLRENLRQNSQYKKNVNDALAWLNMSDAALGEASDTLQQCRELALYAAGGTLPDESLEALAEQIEQLREHLGQVANTNHAGHYIFGGTETQVLPFKDGTWAGNNKDITYGIDKKAQVAINVSGTKAFGLEDDLVNVFNLLENLAQDVRDGNLSKVSGGEPSHLGDLDAAIDNLISLRAELGARVNRLELTQNRLKEIDLRNSELLSKTEDADIALTIVNLKSEENVYKASLATGARMLMPTLLDFLR